MPAATVMTPPALAQSRFARFFRAGAGLLLLLALAYAPLAFGSVPPEAIVGLEILLAALFVLWMISGAFEGFSNTPVGAFLIPCAFIVGFGLIRIFNTIRGGLDSHGIPLGIPRIPFLPTTADPDTAALEMCKIIALFATLWALVDLTRCPRWRIRLLSAISIVGGAVALLGDLQKLGLIPPFAAFAHSQEGSPFATFSYHGNAGTFLNLSMGAAGTLLVRASVKNQRMPRLHLLSAALILLGQSLQNSRTSFALGALEVALLFWISACARKQSQPDAVSRMDLRKVMMVAAVPFIGLVITVAAQPAKWASLPEALSPDSSRPVAWGVGLRLFADAPFAGHGPGSFKLLFNSRSPAFNSELFRKWVYRDYLPGSPVSMWSQLHEDYLQSLVEWGILGTLIWAALFWPLTYVRSRAPSLPKADRMVLYGVTLTVLTALLHALVDFPLQVASIELLIVVYLAMLWSVPQWRYFPADSG